MLATSWMYALMAFGMGAGICCYIIYKKPDVYWGSALDSRAKYKVCRIYLFIFFFELTYFQTFCWERKNLNVTTKLGKRSSFGIDRCQIPLLSGDPEKRLPLIKFVHTLRHGNGTIIYGDVVCGKLREQFKSFNANSRRFLPKQLKIRAFYEKIVAPDLSTGVEALMQLNGLGKLRANILVMGFKNNWHDFTPTAQAEQQLLVNAKKKPLIKSVTFPMNNTCNYWTIALCANTLLLFFCFFVFVCIRMPLEKKKKGLQNGFYDLSRLGKYSVWDLPVSSNITIIDVWWLLDDGGLSLLIPHILSIDQFWKKLSASHHRHDTTGTNHNDKDDVVNNKDNNKTLIRKKQRYIVRLFLVADDNIGGPHSHDEHTTSTLAVPAASLVRSNTSEKNVHMSITHSSKSDEYHFREMSRISSQGLVDMHLLKNLDDTTGRPFLFICLFFSFI
ncbi:hypothetical protein RFI_04109 [Reticulomyxa filosa]|uniref:SLC12A transporter C-terminal domain-containing protein n=1 Tax=Reticulomyxa filosa TaxID=46433 RepID=X6P4E5_RETFI|nr:hypothetical protein RFI_04109 [Reticulomyxa filosa]|eukprot:ETO32998.1 hypothetical protein RFI_04109 [Reticulomyxa filosa]